MKNVLNWELKKRELLLILRQENKGKHILFNIMAQKLKWTDI